MHVNHEANPKVPFHITRHQKSDKNSGEMQLRV